MFLSNFTIPKSFNIDCPALNGYHLAVTSSPVQIAQIAAPIFNNNIAQGICGQGNIRIYTSITEILSEEIVRYLTASPEPFRNSLKKIYCHTLDHLIWSSTFFQDLKNDLDNNTYSPIYTGFNLKDRYNYIEFNFVNNYYSEMSSYFTKIKTSYDLRFPIGNYDINGTRFYKDEYCYMNDFNISEEDFNLLNESNIITENDFTYTLDDIDMFFGSTCQINLSTLEFLGVLKYHGVLNSSGIVSHKLNNVYIASNKYPEYLNVNYDNISIPVVTSIYLYKLSFEGLEYIIMFYKTYIKSFPSDGGGNTLGEILSTSYEIDGIFTQRTQTKKCIITNYFQTICNNWNCPMGIKIIPFNVKFLDLNEISIRGSTIQSVF